MRRKKYTETDFTKPGQDGDIYFSKREGNAIAIRQGDKLEMLSTFQGKASLAKVIGSDKRWENMGPASERLLIDLSMKNLGGLATRETQTERGKLLFKFVSSLESLNEAEKYNTNEFKVGDKIKTNIGVWEVIETITNQVRVLRLHLYSKERI